MVRSAVYECGSRALRSLGGVQAAGIARARKSVVLRVRCEKRVKVRLRIDHQVQFGESHAVLGSARCTGAWEERVPLHWTENGWVVELEADPQEQQQLEFKHVIVTQSGEVVWEGGPNRVLTLPAEGEFEVVTHWDCTHEDLQLQADEEEVTTQPPEAPRLEEPSFLERWQGRAAGKWDTTGLDGPALQIVEGDQAARTWWRKLELARALLTGALPERLVSVAAYLKWINTGQIACVEDDAEHYSPSKPAETVRRMFVELERISGSPQELLMVRKIHLCLPALTASFAPRDDVPLEVKALQEKVHRCAGPEDLVATEALVTRLEECSEPFVGELRAFHSELKEFLNAGTLTEQLEALHPSIDKDTKALLEHFLDCKEKLVALERADGTNIIEPLLDTLHALTNLRGVLVKGLESGLRNDASDTAIAMRQKWRLCEIRLESFSVRLLSRIIIAFDAKGGAAWLAEELQANKPGQWTPALTSLAMGVQQVGFSGAECIAIRNELLAWAATDQDVVTDTKAWAIRLKATVNRARRLAETYTDTVLVVNSRYVAGLAAAFGIPEGTDTEVEMVFPVAQLCSLLLKAIRGSVGGDGFDTIMPGRSAGVLVEVDRIAAPAATGPVILMVKGADGNEEPNAPNVVGVVLQHELPHLSHLGVRARQQNIPFVTCSSEERIAALRPLLNRPVELAASSEFVHIRPYDVPVADEPHVKEKLVNDDQGPSFIRLATLSGVTDPRRISIERSPPGTVLDLASATTPNSGTKAAVCGILTSLSPSSQTVQSDHGVPARFCVPKGMVIPFGAMEDALETTGALDAFNTLITRVETAQIGQELDFVCSELRTLISKLPLSDAILTALKSGIPATSTLIVRSSANIELLEGIAAAGLYESVPNVTLSEPETFGRAVAQVWASLYTRRAVLSRRCAGVPQKEASMAVLVQELLSPELSFILHTVSPIDHEKTVLQAELAVGLGETLASGTRGTPWRLACNKFDGKVMTLAFANFSEQVGVEGQRHVVDYSKQTLSCDTGFRELVGQRLATVGFFLEQHFKEAQDIEGCLVGEEVFLVQSRPQP